MANHQTNREYIFRILNEYEGQPDVQRFLYDVVMNRRDLERLTQAQIRAIANFSARFGVPESLRTPQDPSSNPFAGADDTHIINLLQQQFRNWRVFPDDPNLRTLLEYGADPVDLLQNVYETQFQREFTQNELNQYLQTETPVREFLHSRNRPRMPSLEARRLDMARESEEFNQRGRQRIRSARERLAAGEDPANIDIREPDRDSLDRVMRNRPLTQRELAHAQQPIDLRRNVMQGAQGPEVKFDDGGEAYIDPLELARFAARFGGEVPRIPFHFPEPGRAPGRRPRWADYLRIGGVIGAAAIGAIGNYMQPPEADLERKEAGELEEAEEVERKEVPPIEPDEPDNNEVEEPGEMAVPQPPEPAPVPAPAPVPYPIDDPEHKRRKHKTRLRGEPMHNQYEREVAQLPHGYAYYPDPFKHKPQIDHSYVGDYRLPVFGRHNYIRWTKYTQNNAIASAY